MYLVEDIQFSDVGFGSEAVFFWESSDEFGIFAEFTDLVGGDGKRTDVVH